ncbi:MAG: pilus assembly FimT family protein [Planctomycetota bacterium]|jgi:hypothetical protein
MPMRARAYTLIEVALVVSILVAITAIVIPNFILDYERDLLPGSSRDMRSLVSMVRAKASFASVRYRIRFPMPDEDDEIGDGIQPIVEREVDPVNEPEIFERVTEPWAVGTILRSGIRCAEVRLGKPDIEQMRDREFRSEVEEVLDRAFEEFDPVKPPVVIEPDGTSDWFVLLLTNAPEDVPVEDLADSEEYQSIEIIVDGRTGAAWLQRPLYDEELDLFEEEGWPIVLRQDFLDPRVLTEDDVLELQDIPIDQLP